MLKRVISCQKYDSVIRVTDTVENQGDRVSPFMLLYHLNVGYPLLTEQAQISVSSVNVEPCDDYAAQGLHTWNEMPPPQRCVREQCYKHTFADTACARICNPACRKGMELTFDPKELDHLIQWKEPGYRDYVLGLEPGNCTTDGRDRDRARGILKFLQPGEQKSCTLTIRFFSM